MPAGIYLIDVIGGVTNNFEEIYNNIVNEEITVNGDTYNSFEEYITHVTESTGGFTKIVYDQTTGDAIFQEWDEVTNTWVNVDNSKFETIVQANESQTVIITVDDQQYYVSEAYLAVNDGVVPTTVDPTSIPDGIYLIDVIDGVTNNFEEIYNNIVNEEITINDETYNSFEEYITYITESTGGFTKIVYDETTGDVIFQEWDESTNTWVNVDNSKFETIVQANETLTSATFDATTGILTYNDEDGTANAIDLSTMVANFETLTSIQQDTAAGTITYVDEEGNPTVLNIADIIAQHETLTSATFDAATGILTYNDEDGTANAIDLSTMVANFETLTSISQDTAAGTITYVDEEGNPTVLNIADIIAQHETLTSATFDATTGILTYNDEDGTANAIDLSTMVANFETLTSISQDTAAGTITYVDEEGNPTVLNIADIIAQYETLTTFV